MKLDFYTRKILNILFRCNVFLLFLPYLSHLMIMQVKHLFFFSYLFSLPIQKILVFFFSLFPIFSLSLYFIIFAQFCAMDILHFHGSSMMWCTHMQGLEQHCYWVSHQNITRSCSFFQNAFIVTETQIS